jgi:uncharacterized protein (TIGR03083 family)
MNAESATTRSTEWYLDHVTADAARFAAVLETAAHDLPIQACPGWDLGRLAEHLGQIHRWAAFCATHARPPSADETAALQSFEPDRAAEWLREGAAALVATLRDLDPEAPTWHPFPVDKIARIWPRRQAHETAVHRWDAESAAGIDAMLDPELASDGIDEYFEIALPRLIVREGIRLPDGSLHVHCTDVAGEWLVSSQAGEFRMIREHRKGDAALRGPAEPILLHLWGRASDRATELSSIGDESVLQAWLAIPGM